LSASQTDFGADKAHFPNGCDSWRHFALSNPRAFRREACAGLSRAPARP